MNPVKKSSEQISKRPYPSFSRLNGEHPFKAQVPGGRVEYKARYRKGGKVSFLQTKEWKRGGLFAAGNRGDLLANRH